MRTLLFAILGLIGVATTFDQTSTTTDPVSNRATDPAHAMEAWALTSITWADIPQPADNPITQDKVDLGAMLFFDPRLSESNTMSCASCHQSDKGYSDNLPLFVGDHGEIGARNTPTVANLAWNSTFFWDGRAASLEEQAIGPIASMAEMRQPLAELIGELEAAGYKPYFQKAFGAEATISEETIGKAIATFERILVSHNAPFDQYMAGDQSAMTPAQIRGMELFQAKARCAECHSGPQFTDGSFHNLGVDTLDVGRYGVLPLPAMKYAFKTPGLRDIAYSAPYLHNGAAATLRDVVVFYNEGGAVRSGNIGIEPLGLTSQEIDDVAAFMEALSGEGAHNFPAPILP